MYFTEAVDRVQRRLQKKETHRSQRRKLSNKAGDETSINNEITWNWVAANLLQLVAQYPSGLTEAIILSELEGQNTQEERQYSRAGSGRKLNNLDALTDGKIVPPEAVFETCVSKVYTLPGASTPVLTLTAVEGGRSVDMYLHQKFWSLREEPGILKQNRILRMTGTRCVTTPTGGIRLLPSEYMAYVLSEKNDMDQQFLKKHFDQRLVDIVAGQECGGGVLVKVQNIGTVQPGRHFGHVKRLEIEVNDTTVEENVSFYLWDEQIGLASLFQKGDLIAMWRPFVTINKYTGLLNGGTDATSTMLEYGTQTVLFVIPMDPAKERALMSSHGGYSSDQKIPRDSQGILDYQNFPERIAKNHLVPKMINVSLFGKVVKLARNPNSLAQIIHDSCGIRLLDPLSGENIDVTLWDEASRNILNTTFAGDWIFLENVATTENVNARIASGAKMGQTQQQVEVIGKPKLGTRVWNVSTAAGFLSSPFLHTEISLADAIDTHMDTFMVRATISDWKDFYDNEAPDIIDLHSLCDRPVHRTPQGTYECTWCKEEVVDRRPAMNFQVTLDDSTEYLDVEVGYKFGEAILGLSVSEYSFLDEEGRLDMMDCINGEEIECIVVRSTEIRVGAPSYIKFPKFRISSLSSVAPDAVVSQSLGVADWENNI
ncbi:hypothetical protein DFS34DRAFT_79113 [Phlyctochytrium arcticum]|nr:hypothetical protein DFS34DRAFT_79113 [Phlyctochytrium arcticum]